MNKYKFTTEQSFRDLVSHISKTHRAQFFGIFFVLTISLLVFGLTPKAYSQTDTTPPTFSNFTILTPTIDTTLGPATFMATVDVQDDLSGVSFVGINFRNPSNNTNIGASCSLFSGDSLSGTWKCSRTLPQFSEGGTYEAHPSAAIQTGDIVGNRLDVPKSDLVTLGFDTTFFYGSTG